VTERTYLQSTGVDESKREGKITRNHGGRAARLTLLTKDTKVRRERMTGNNNSRRKHYVTKPTGKLRIRNNTGGRKTKTRKGAQSRKLREKTKLTKRELVDKNEHGKRRVPITIRSVKR